MNTLLDRFGSALTTILVTALIAFGTMVVTTHEHNAEQQTQLQVIELRLDHIEKDLEKLEKRKQNKGSK